MNAIEEQFRRFIVDGMPENAVAMARMFFYTGVRHACNRLADAIYKSPDGDEVDAFYGELDVLEAAMDAYREEMKQLIATGLRRDQ